MDKNFDKLDFVPSVPVRGYLKNFALTDEEQEEFIKYFDLKCRAAHALNAQWFQVFYKERNRRSHTYGVIHHFIEDWIERKGKPHEEKVNESRLIKYEQDGE